MLRLFRRKVSLEVVEIILRDTPLRRVLLDLETKSIAIATISIVALVPPVSVIVVVVPVPATLVSASTPSSIALLMVSPLF